MAETNENTSDLEPVDILKDVQDLPVKSLPTKEADINVNLDSEDNDNEQSSSNSSFVYLELVKNILFKILDIIYNRFFDVVNDFNAVYNESMKKLN